MAGSEIELKLKASPADFPKLRAALPRLGRILRPAETRHVVTYYYETPDLALARYGVALRLRDSDGEHCQGLKARSRSSGNGGGIAAVRQEWEWPVEANELDFGRLDGEGAASLLPAHAPATLQSIFATDVRRTETELESGDGTRIKLAFDRGRIVAEERSRALSEIELELADKGPVQQEATLYRLALELQRAAPVTIATASKADRGYELVTEQPPPSVKQSRVDFPKSISVRDGFRLILRSCFDHMLANQAAALVETETGGVHQMRVAVRRLRSALKLFDPLIASPEAEWLDREFRWLGTELGRARDWDVFVGHTIDGMVEESGLNEAGELVRRCAAGRRRAAHRAAVQAIETPRYTTLVLALGIWIEEDRWCERLDTERRAEIDGPLSTISDELLKRMAKKVARAGRSIGHADAAGRHNLRKKAKKLRYAGNFLASLYPKKRTKRHLDALSDLQDLLGEMNDYATARTMVDQLAEEEPRKLAKVGPPLKDTLDHLEARRLKALPALWRRYGAAKPFWM